MRRMGFARKRRKVGVKRRAPILPAELPGLHRPPSLEAVQTCVPGPARR